MYDDPRGCDCICDVMNLGSHIFTCNYTRETLAITKEGITAWITYSSVKNTSDYLIYPYCPIDYCLPPDAGIEMTFQMELMLSMLAIVLAYSVKPAALD